MESPKEHQFANHNSKSARLRTHSVFFETSYGMRMAMGLSTGCIRVATHLGTIARASPWNTEWISLFNPWQSFSVDYFGKCNTQPFHVCVSYSWLVSFSTTPNEPGCK